MSVISEHVGSRWLNLGRMLEFTDGQLETIKADYDRDGLREVIYQMLRQWKSKEASKAKLTRIVIALSNAYCTDAIRELRKVCVE